MSQTQTQAMSVEVNKVINAPAEKVFKAWSDAEQMSKWFGCNKVGGVRVTHDFRVGGQYKIDAMGCEDNKSKVVFGTYKEIVPNKKIVFSWSNNSEQFPAKDTLVAVEFIDQGKSTKIVLKHTKFVAAETAQGHNMGWQECLDKLAKLVA